MMQNPEYILEINNLCNHYIQTSSSFFKNNRYNVLKDISLSIKCGEIFGLVGESGCGKSTLARAIAGLVEVEGDIVIDNEVVKGNRSKSLCKKVQMIFQDPLSSLNPCKTVGWILEEPLRIHKIGNHKERKKRVYEVLNLVGLDSFYYDRYPSELSGGQRQRVSIGCAIILNPKLIIADEPVSALDMSVQAQILNLLKDLHRKLELSFLFISHNLNVIYYLCDRVAVMYLGCIVEIAKLEDIYNCPKHPYTKVLLSSVPDFSGNNLEFEKNIYGEVNDKDEIAEKGCVFYSRCSMAEERCKRERPALKCIDEDNQNGHFVSCYLV